MHVISVFLFSHKSHIFLCLHTSFCALFLTFPLHIDFAFYCLETLQKSGKIDFFSIYIYFFPSFKFKFQKKNLDLKKLKIPNNFQISCSTDGSIRVWHGKSGECLSTFRVGSEDYPILNVIPIPKSDPPQMIVCNRSNTLYVVNISGQVT